MMRKTLINKILSLFVAFSLCLGFLMPSAQIIASAVGEIKSDFNKPNFNYVALGASNVNGYGMHGYNFENVYEAPFEKVTDNRYGYEMDTPGSYTMLIKEKLSKDYNVNLSQIAMSSLRAEELHFLLDDSYNGDSYTDTWFYDTNGDGVSSNWYYGAAVYEWNILVEKGLKDSDYAPTSEELLQTLREVTQKKVAEADLITVDIGMNNFGTYMLNLLASGIFSNDLNTISPIVDQYYDFVRDYILDVIKNYIGDDVIPSDTLGKVSDTLAYALVGYCVNFDETMKEIYALNPDADVVVVSIQNMMRDLEVVFPGSTVKLPFGEIFGVVVSAANLYTSMISPYASTYYYANVNTDGRAEFFIDEIGAYNGDPSSLSVNMMDCFDTYDGTLYIKTRVQQMFAIEMNKQGLVNIDESQKDTSSLESLYAFHYGYHYDVKNANSFPTVTLNDGTPLKDLIKKGEAGKLSGKDKDAYDTYVRMLNVAHDVTAELLREGSKPKIIDFMMLGAAAVMGVSVDGMILDKMEECVEKVIADPSYTFDASKEYPEGALATLARENNISVEILETAFTTALYMQFGSTVFSHPNENGYKTIANKVWRAYSNKLNGTDVILEKMSIEYMPTEDSYYVAVNGTEDGYAGIFAEYLGLDKNQTGFTSLDNVDYSEISKADLISISFDDAKTLDFTVNQMSAYLANYIAVDVRSSANSFISSVVDKIGSNISFLPTGTIKNALTGKVDETIDTLLENQIFAGKEMQELDWSRFMNDEQVAYIEAMKREIRRAIVEAIGFEEYTLEMDMVLWISQNADSLGLNSMISSIVGNADMLYGILGDSATLSIDIPVADALLFAVESYLYSYVEYTVRTAQLISYINTNHPNTKVLIVSPSISLDGIYLELGDIKLDIGAVLGGLETASTVRQFAQFCISDNASFVYAYNVSTVYQTMVEDKEQGMDLINFFKLYFSDRSILEISEEGHEYIARQMLKYMIVLCEHEYSDCVDTLCNKCGDEREAIGHSFGEWMVQMEPTVDNAGSEIRMCINCGYSVIRSIIPTPVPTPLPVTPIVLIVIGVITLGTVGYSHFRKTKSNKKSPDKSENK